MNQTYVGSSERVHATDAFSRDRRLPDLIDTLCAMAVKALPAMLRTDNLTLVQTVRKAPSAANGLAPEGLNLRYTAIVALGLNTLAVDDQRAVLNGKTAADLALHAADLAASGGYATDLGASALAAWAVAEICNRIHEPVLDRVIDDITHNTSQPTVDYAWGLTALAAAWRLRDVSRPAQIAAARLKAEQGGKGIFGHHLPATDLAKYRAHVGCFADQVYPIQALARYAALTGDGDSMAAANRCAARIVELQGDDGQWWWHYDARTGDVVEGFPVYSVHQHAMAPMALFDLWQSGGDDHRSDIVAGLDWMTAHPETSASLLDDQTGVIWRKVGRKEPRKAVRSLRAISTSVSPSLRLRPLDLLFKPGKVDYECRPYELGWLLYAWLSTRSRQPASGSD